MTWYEPSGAKHRARRYKPGGSGEQQVGPRFATEALAKRWAIAQGWDEGFSHKLVDIVEEWRRVRMSEAAAHHTVDPRFLTDVAFRLAAVFRKMEWIDVRELTIAEIDRWRTNPDGVGFKRNADYLLAILRWARRHLKVIVDQDVIDWRFPRKRNTLIARNKLTTDQVLDILEAGIGHSLHVHALLHYLATYGPRPATACALRIRQVDFRNGTLDLNAKHSGEWRHKLQAQTLEHFAQLAYKRDPNEHLFLRPFIGSGIQVVRRTELPWELTKNGEANQLGRWYQRNITKVLQLPADLVQLYHLKRYAITTALRAGLTPKEVALFTGHLSTEQVLKYAETNVTESGEAVDRLGPKAPLQIAKVAAAGSRSAHTRKHTNTHRTLKRKPR